MNIKYIQYLRELNNIKISELLSQFESNKISFDELQSGVLDQGVFTIQSYNKEQKIKDLLNETK